MPGHLFAYYERDAVFFSNCNPISTFVVKAVVTFISKFIALYVTNNSKSLKYNVQYKFIPLGFFCTHIFSENRTPDEFLVNFDIFTKIEGTKKALVYVILFKARIPS